MGSLKSKSASGMAKIERKKIWFVFPKTIYCRSGEMGENVI